MTMRSTLASQFVLTLILFGLSPVMAQSTTFDASAWPGASVACISALSASVSCNMVLSSLYGSSYYTHWDLDSLDSICQPDCYTSLQAHSASVLSACGSTQYYNEPSDSYYLPNILDLQMLYAYGKTCMESNGAYCETYFQNSTAQSLCDDCWVKLYQFEINNALDGVDDDLASSFVALTQSCSATQYPTTSPTPALVTSSTAAVATCTGSTYQVQSTDTMYSVSVSQRISTNMLLNINGLSYNKSDFPTSGTLCISNQCDIHLVSAIDTCTSIAIAYGISNSNLLTWNSNINPLCTNLDTMLNDAICISNPFPTATTTAPTSTTATRPFSYTFSAGPASRVPFTKWEDLLPTPTSSPIPLANGTRTDCISYIALANSSELNCWIWADLNEIRRSDFVNWNPSLDPSTRISGPAYSYPCTLAPSSSYCLQLSSTTTTIIPDVQPIPTPTLPDQINQCYDWIRPWEGYTCDDALDETGLTFARFYEMNPSIQSDCSQLIVNMWYCAASHNYSRPAVIPASTTASSTTASTATSCTATSVAVTFNELVTTIYGQTIKIVGSIPELASWDSANAIALSADSYTSSNPLWSVTIPLALGTVFEYKYINVAPDGTVTWEADPNETFTVPAACTTAVTVSNTWR